MKKEIEKLINDLKLQQEYNAMLQSLDSINALLYKNMEPNKTNISTYVKCLLFELVNKHKKYNLTQQIKEYNLKLQEPNLDKETKNTLENKLKESQKELNKIDLLIANSSHDSISIHNKIKKDYSSSTEEDRKKVIKEIQKIQDNYILIDNKISNISVKNKENSAQEKNTSKDPSPEYEELLNKFNILQKEYKSKSQDYDSLKSELENLKKQINQMKDKNDIKEKIQNNTKKVKRKVIAVKDCFVDFAKEHKIATTVIILALAGLVGSTIAFGTPLAGVGRICSGLYRVFYKLGFNGPLKSLHSINKLIFGRFKGATFNELSGVWSVGGKALNNLSAFETILRSMEGVALAAGAAYGVAKVSKKAWLAISKTKFKTKLKDKILKLKEATIDKISPKFKKLFNKKDDSYNNREEKIYNIALDMPLEDLQECIKIMEETLATNDIPENLQGLSLEEIKMILELSKKAYEEKSKKANNNVSGLESLIKSLDSASEDNLNSIIINVGNILEHFDQDHEAIIKLFANYGLNSIEEVNTYYETAKETYANKFGGIKR